MRCFTVGTDVCKDRNIVDGDKNLFICGKGFDPHTFNHIQPWDLRRSIMPSRSLGKRVQKQIFLLGKQRVGPYTHGIIKQGN